MDEVRVYQRELSGEEVKKIYWSEEKPVDLVLVAGGTLPASSPLGAVSVDTFYIGKTEVTWGEWRTVRAWAVTNGYPDLANVGTGIGDNYPVTHVNWYDVVKWCNARSEKEGKTPVYKNGSVVYRTGNVSEPAIVASANGYRLPSEKEWEFAARGGTQTQGYIYSGSNDLNAIGWYNENSGSAVKEVGKKQANELGIYDMSGNLWEWTGSWYPGFEDGQRVIRGGCWNDPAHSVYLTAGFRGNWPFDSRNNNGLGFRVAASGEYALAITTQPFISPAGTTIGVQAEGAGTLTYQWRFNGVAIAGGTSSHLATQGLQSGTYTVLVSNGFASVTSASIQYAPSPIGAFAIVTGGLLPASSPLGGVSVSTFYIGKTEVTWGEWQTVRIWAVANGYTDLANVGQGVGDNYPVTHVSWHDVVKWCNARSEKEGKTAVYMVNGAVYKSGQVTPIEAASANGYRLPSEQEWEFAARGGTQTNGYTYSGSNDLNAVGWYLENSSATVHEVGKKLANELGLYEMSGNLWEWTGSWYPGSEGSARMIRGGGWNVNAGYCTVAFRFSYNQALRDSAILGFRLALSYVPEMVLVTGGTLPASSPLGAVTVNTFYIGRTEVTWGEWQTVRAWAVNNGYTDLANVGQGVGDNYPAKHISWYDSVKWCNARSEKEGKTPVYRDGTAVYRTGEVLDPQVSSSANGYRLPSEKEWEFAARGGTLTHGYTYSGSNNLDAVGWYLDNSANTPREVGKKLANELGIYDMSGSQYEWCADWHPHNYAYGGPIRLIRGGAAHCGAEACSVFDRPGNSPNQRDFWNSFRVALNSTP
jgi:formylglycine-generating enzyme required for sulfatase activity